MVAALAAAFAPAAGTAVTFLVETAVADAAPIPAAPVPPALAGRESEQHSYAGILSVEPAISATGAQAM
jgi:hypothetical protein